MHISSTVILCSLIAMAESFHGASAQAVKHYQPYYLPAASQPNYAAVIPPPPARGSTAQVQDAEAVRMAEEARSAEEVRAAQRDDAEEDIFVYATVMGPNFNAEHLPKTAALSAHLRNDVGVVSPPLKALYNRPRPFVEDTALHPVCEKKVEGSYPSGHASIGYITGLVLAQIVPERSAAILDRANEYAQHRITCGVHYPTDVEASHSLALVMLGELSISPRFQADVQAARAEIRATLALP